MDKSGHRRREEEAFDNRFAVGESVIAFMREHGCSKIAACKHIAEEGSLGIRALMAAHTTAKTFPANQRRSAVGYTKHQSLAEVSRKNLPFACSNEDYRRGLREALDEIALKDIPVNVLNSDGVNSAKNVLTRAIRRIQRN